MHCSGQVCVCGQYITEGAYAALLQCTSQHWGCRHAGICAVEPGSAGRRQVFLAPPLAHGVGVADYQLVYPGEGLGEQHRPLEEAQVSAMLRQHKHHVGLLLWMVGKKHKKQKHKVKKKENVSFLLLTYVSHTCGQMAFI